MMPNKNLIKKIQKIIWGLEFLNKPSDQIKKYSDVLKNSLSTDQELEKLIDPALLSEIEKSIPVSLFDAFQLENVSVSEIKKIYESLDITTIAELEYACKANRLILINTFNKETQDRILNSIKTFKRNHGTFLLSDALIEATLLVNYLKSQLNQEVEIVGSLRRRCEVIKNINLITEFASAEKIIQTIKSYPNFDSFFENESNNMVFFLKNEISCEIIIAPKEDYVSLKRYYTGSRPHNLALEKHAHSKGFNLKPDGLYQNNKKLNIINEEELYKKLGLNYIEPELREGLNEVQNAAAGALPHLVVYEQIKGTFHCHTLYSDGTASIEDMVKKAQELGLEYIGISEHSHSFPNPVGLKKKKVMDEIKEIKKLQKNYKIRILKGIESDILENGDLDYNNSLLKELDFVIGSIHQNYNQTKDLMTKRVLTAFENPFFDILGHPTGRLLTAVEPFDIDLSLIIEKAAKCKVAIELNASPRRLDIDWRYGKEILKNNCLICINPDAHSPAALEDLHYGVSIARKAGLGPDQILNTRPLEQTLILLRRNFKN